MPFVLRLNLLLQRFDALLIACALHLQTVASRLDDDLRRASLVGRGPSTYFYMRLSPAGRVACTCGQKGNTIFSYA